MTYEEALEVINIAIAEVEWEYSIEYAAAFEKAKEAIKLQIDNKPENADHRKQRGRTAPNRAEDSPCEFVYCDECYYNSGECPGDMRCEDIYTQLFDHGCTGGNEAND